MTMMLRGACGDCGGIIAPDRMEWWRGCPGEGATRMSSDAATIEPGRPVVLRRGTVLTMNDAHDVLHDADVLVVDDRIAGVGAGLEAPEGAYEIDASGGIVMPGMIDTHRHMWQTALRGYGADW